MSTTNTVAFTTTHLSGERPEVLFDRAQRDGDTAAREELVVRFLPLARRLARRYARPTVPYDDLAQVASLALIKAVDRFDRSRGKPFHAFAIPTILGELKRHFRDTSWALHVTRSAQERALAIEAAASDMGNQLGRSPTVQELAVALELDQDEVLDGLRAAASYTTVPLDAPLQSNEGGEELPLHERLGHEDARYEYVEARLTVADAVRTLSANERNVLRLTFCDELTQTEIGKRLGVSQMQVSRLVRRSLERVRELVGADSALRARRQSDKRALTGFSLPARG